MKVYIDYLFTYLMKKHDKIAMYALLIIVALILVASYYLSNQDAPVRDTGLVGDQLCGNFVSEENQDSCCSEGHKNDFAVQCVGNWQFISGLNKCQYVCDDGLIACPEDAKVCEDGSVVVRDHENECEFRTCP